jgi:hypothetical protein
MHYRPKTAALIPSFNEDYSPYLCVQSQLSVEQVASVMEQAKQGQISNAYLDPNFTISPELIDRLQELLAGAAKI